MLSLEYDPKFKEGIDAKICRVCKAPDQLVGVDLSWHLENT
tara:strand:+ start:6252 stop:6374 length:123 start_codon:yes stop_codon:yes gene_type:complete